MGVRPALPPDRQHQKAKQQVTCNSTRTRKRDWQRQITNSGTAQPFGVCSNPTVSWWTSPKKFSTRVLYVIKLPKAKGI